MIRSPTKSVSSDTDMPKSCESDPKQAVTGKTRSKKTPNETVTTSSMNEFMKKMQSSIGELKSSMDLSIAEVNRNINDVIKTELSNLSVSISSIKTEVASLRTDYSIHKRSLDTLKSKQKDIDSTLSSIQHSMEFTSDKVEKMEHSLNVNEAAVKKLESQGQDQCSIVASVSRLQNELNQFQQQERALNLEIVGLPENRSENLMSVVINIAKHAGVSMSPREIIHVSRVQPRQAVTGRPRVVVVKLAQKNVKDDILTGLRKVRGISTKNLDIQGDARPIFVNEHLTIINKALYKQCRELAKAKLYQFIWIKNCKIYVRKNDTSPKIIIQREEDLKKIF